jgi:hypothetical protein
VRKYANAITHEEPGVGVAEVLEAVANYAN